MKSIVFVFIQFSALGLIALTGPVIPSSLWLAALEFAGILLGVWAVLTVRIGNFNITPDVKPDSRMVTTGPYALIRHPMYSALLVTTLPLIINSHGTVRLLLWLVLLVDLVWKLNYEEGLLKDRHPHYAKYMETSYRLFPYIY